VKIELKCDMCSKKIWRYPSQIKTHNFCSRVCLAAYSNKSKNPHGYADLKDYRKISEHMTKLNRELNPERMTEQTRKKLREVHLDSGEGKTYTKIYGKLAHRVVAEQILGRPLKQEEVVHHLDFNRRNNEPWNLMILPSNEAHLRYHAKLKKFFEKGIIDEWVVEEVVPDGVQTA